MSTAILLVGHGSRDEDGNKELLEFVERVRASAPELLIECCFLELARPTIAQGIDKCVAEGAKKVALVPIILLPAGHVKIHIPAEIDRAKKLYPHVEFTYGRPIGVHEKVLAILRTRLAEMGMEIPDWTAQSGGSCSVPEGTLRLTNTAVLLLGRGSSDADSNGDLFKISRFLWEQVPVQFVEVGFIGVTEPSYPNALERCLRLGAERIIVLPYFLFTGVLIKRIEELTQQFASQHPQVQVDLAGYFGFHPMLVELILERALEAAEGRALMNCDMCKYRMEAAVAHLHHHHHDHDHGHDHHHDHHHGHHHDHDHHHGHDHDHDHHHHEPNKVEVLQK